MSKVFMPTDAPTPTRLGLLVAVTSVLGGAVGICLALVSSWQEGSTWTDSRDENLLMIGSVPAWLATTSGGGFLVRSPRSRPVGSFLLATGVVMGAWFITIGFWRWWYYSCDECATSDLLGDFSYGITETLQFSFLGMILLLLPHLYPDGITSGRLWRNIFRGAVAAFVGAFAYWLTVAGGGILHVGPAGYAEVGRTVVHGLDGEPIGEDSGYWLALEGAFLASMLFMLVSASAVMVRRWRKSSAPVRRQLKIFAFAEAVTVGLILVLGLIRELRSSESAPGRLFSIVLLAQAGGPVLVVLAIAIAVLRYNLYDIRIVIRRAVVYTALTSALTAVFVAVYGTFSWLARELNSPGTAWIAAVAGVAVVLGVEPGRRHLQRRLERWLLGDRGDPLRAVERLRERVVTGEEEVVHRGLVETVATAVRSPSVGLALHHGPRLELVASTSPPDPDATVVPLLHRGERLGEFRVSTRTPGEGYDRSDEALLHQLAGQAAAHVYGLRRDAELAAMRQQALTATISERSRLGRDLHDGLAPLIAGAGLSAEALRRGMSPGSPEERSAAVLAARLRGATTELRRIAHDLQPGPLAVRGLTGAIRDYIASLTGPDLPTFDVRVSAERLPPAVEIVIYRVVLEAVANVVRHARAGRSTVVVDMHDRDIEIDVQDDGTGLPHPYISGVGIASMRSRVEALGGELTLQPQTEGGTLLHARLPLGAG